MNTGNLWFRKRRKAISRWLEQKNGRLNDMEGVFGNASAKN
jgi:hypothetical protein